LAHSWPITRTLAGIDLRHSELPRAPCRPGEDQGREPGKAKARSTKRPPVVDSLDGERRAPVLGRLSLGGQRQEGSGGRRTEHPGGTPRARANSSREGARLPTFGSLSARGPPRQGPALRGRRSPALESSSRAAHQGPPQGDLGSPRVPFLKTTSDVAAVFKALARSVNIAYALSALAGLSPGHAIALERDGVDLETGTIQVRRQIRDGKLGISQERQSPRGTDRAEPRCGASRLAEEESQIRARPAQAAPERRRENKVPERGGMGRLRHLTKSSQRESRRGPHVGDRARGPLERATYDRRRWGDVVFAQQRSRSAILCEHCARRRSERH
jgi:hypothetical protein